MDRNVSVFTKCVQWRIQKLRIMGGGIDQSLPYTYCPLYPASYYSPKIQLGLMSAVTL